MIRFAPTLTTSPHAHIGHLFNYIAAKQFAEKNGKEFAVRMDMHPHWSEGVPAHVVTEHIELFKAEKQFIHVSPLSLSTLHRDAFMLSSRQHMEILEMSRGTMESHGQEIKMLTMASILWDRRFGITDIIRDNSMRSFVYPKINQTTEQMEVELYDFLRLPKPEYHYIPTLIYDKNKISGSWYGQCPKSCRLSVSKIGDSLELLSKILVATDPIEFIDTDIKEIAVDAYVEEEEPVMHGDVKVYL